MLPKCNSAKYLSLIDASSGYHNLKIDEKSSNFMMFVCQFGRYSYIRLPFGAAPAGDMFQRKIDEIFKDMPNVFGIVDDILVAGYEADGTNHDKTVWRVLQRWRQVNLKLNRDKCHFSPILGGSHIMKWGKTRPTEDQGPDGDAIPQNKKSSRFFWVLLIT